MVGSPNPNGSSSPTKKYGITNPISVAGPTDADLHRNDYLEKFLINSGLYESQEEAARREEVLGRIAEIVKDWVKLLTRQRGYTDQMVEDANAVIFTFGSYRLGVSITLCDFLDFFFRCLSSLLYGFKRKIANSCIM
uniref:Poly(A) polymerase nucleotidyltransferase domain-containing protein n=1 Tax=Cannabis sativa TaxID=3483 RepID=A0A803RC12_CANSA